MLVLLLCLALAACHSGEQTFHRSATPRYFRLVDTLSIRKLEILNPWQEASVMARYYLVRDSATSTPDDGERIQVPVHSIATTSATHIGFLSELGCLSRVTAMTTPHLIYNSPKQPVVDLGEDIHLNVEALLKAHPDVLLLSAYSNDNPMAQRIEEAGIPVVYTVEWLEQDPLARAAWINLIGVLTDTEQQAQSVLQSVTQAYRSQQHLAEQQKDTRSIMTGAAYCGTWYVPTGATYMGCLLMDAGADYAYANRTSSTSLPLTSEEAMTSFSQADVWIGCNASSLQELRVLDEKNTWFNAYQHQQVYNFYRRQTATGANDFWELGAVHPELILKDIRWALYPETFPADFEPTFIQRLEP